MFEDILTHLTGIGTNHTSLYQYNAFNLSIVIVLSNLLQEDPRNVVKHTSESAAALLP